MSAYCPEGVLTCRDAEAGPCVVGYPCELHPSQTQADGGEEWVTGVELHCDDCQKPYARWFADSPEWNLVMGGPEAKDDPGGMLCPRCFTLRAEKVYTLPVWRLWLDRENRVKVSRRDAAHAEQLAQARAEGALKAMDAPGPDGAYGGFMAPGEWADWSNELAGLLTEDDAFGNAEGAQESILFDTFKAWADERVAIRSALNSGASPRAIVGLIRAALNGGEG